MEDKFQKPTVKIWVTEKQQGKSYENLPLAFSSFHEATQFPEIWNSK